MTLITRLPEFPWDSLSAAATRASAHPDGIVDLSVGTPVDATPDIAVAALMAAADAHGYPAVWGTAALRQSIIGYLQRRWNASGVLHDECVLPVIGSKELVGWLPTLLGLNADDVVVIPTLAYPTYEIGALSANCSVVRCDDPALAPAATKLIWLNSPANPHGAIICAKRLMQWVEVARRIGALLAVDECYGEFAWSGQPVSVLDYDICGDELSGLLAVHSVSKRSNMAGYRAGFVAGDPKVVMELLGVRKHLGMMVAAPVQAALAAVLDDDAAVQAQVERYRARRNMLKPALEAAGFTIEHSAGGLYLWCTRNENCRASVDWLAQLGILVAPGDFYGSTGIRHVRVALTASDERIAAAVARLKLKSPFL
ncbi:MAG: succinyldiaminopimelate transaminase [Propionibacteriaceae bacterium]|jgi:succinyldiaminopimelate transaminase|nr:succinyldiaminopimelate transaminase [Propionibacteriaceae bacterium]